MQNTWSQTENDLLLEAIERGVSVAHIIEIVTGASTRSEASVRRRLEKLGYLRSCGRSFKGKQGFVR